MIRPFAAYAVRLWPEVQVWMTEDGLGWQRTMRLERHLFWYGATMGNEPVRIKITRGVDCRWQEGTGQLVIPVLYCHWIRWYWNQTHHERLVATVPEKERKIFRELNPMDGLRVLKFIQASRAAVDLFACNPGLGYLLANALRFRKGIRFEQSVALATLPQRRILVALGLPPSEHLRCLLMRLSIRDLEPRSMAAVLKIAAKSEAFDLLQHVESLTPEVVDCLANEAGLPLYTRRFIMDVAAMSTSSVLCLINVEKLLDAAAYGLWRIRPLQSLLQYQKQMTGLHRRLRSACVTLPPPPCIGDRTIEPLTHPGAIISEGETMHHCLGSASDLLDVLKGRSYFYRMLVPQRATVELRRQAYGCWVIAQLRLHRNKEPAAESREYAEQRFSRWLGDGFQIEVKPDPFEKCEPLCILQEI